MVQDILNALNSDPVNSINDTPEGLQVAQIVQTSYYNLISNRNWPQEKRTFALDSLSDITKPTYMKAPSGMKELISLFYDQKRDVSDRKMLQPIQYLAPESFLDQTNSRNETADNVDLVNDFGGIQIKVRNDTPPMWWTSFDETYIVFDSYDSDVETNLQTSNSQCTGYIEQDFEMADDFIPNLPDEGFGSLLAESKAQAFSVLRQEINARVEREAQKQSNWLSRKAWALAGGIKTPNYGRTRHMSGSDRNPQLDKYSGDKT
jgi:hypothetical protein